ncbi:protein phosphatase 2C domain-containing protein [Kitasatospora purpeofusca]|uniref:protein phosphatase 2C domain-containing protein n=1 Tax=Kitasatospora purpeofusca TaxID=67352 RepID=UPI002A59C105|nr:protein phosphatase 2C domain-containing protein [Kitasatospora purpeofusca]MDY0813603.1 protein phosphatase 2C domain-containing protein [Kitasatospora purpeofusca]
MTEQGAPAQQRLRPDDGWWDTVYAGPAGTLPDTPDAGPGEGSVDDWFATAAGLIGQQRATDGEAGESGESGEAEKSGEAEEAEAVQGDREVLERDSIDDWFDTAVGVIAPQRPADEAPGADDTRRFPAPAWAEAGPAAPAEPPEAADTAAEPAPRVPEPRTGPDPVAAPAPAPAPASAAVSQAEAAAEPEPEPASEAPAPESAPEPEPEASAPVPVPVPVPEPVAAPPAPRPDPRPGRAGSAPAVPHVGERPPTYGPEPTAVPEADPGALGGIVADTVLEGAQYAATTLRAVSVRGDSARYRGEPRRDSLLVTRFGEGADGLLLAVLGGFDHSGPAAGPVATASAEACRQLAGAVGRSREGLAADLRDGARDRLRYGLQRLVLGAVAPLRALAPVVASDRTADGAAEADGDEEPSPASLHCLLVSLDPEAGYRAAFGVGPGGLYLLRSGHWIDAYAARLLHHPDGQPPLPESPVPGPRPFRFRMVPATPGDILLLCTPGLARPVADEPAVAHFLASHWAHPHPPGTVDFLRQVQVRAKGYTDDRTAAAIWTE